MLVGWRVEELDLGRELAPILLLSEDIECVFFCDVPLDGGVGAGGGAGGGGPTLLSSSKR